MEVTPTGITMNDQQRDRIAGLLALEVQELSSIFLQLQDATQSAAASNKLFQQLDARATQLAGAESWKVQAEESKASLATEKINFGMPLPSFCGLKKSFQLLQACLCFVTDLFFLLFSDQI
jgi:hypothetical protein